MRFLVFFFILILSSCSQIKFAYNNAGWLLRPKIYKYSSFDQKQKEIIRTELDSYLDWHRRTMLPEYAKFLNQMNKQVQRPVLSQDDLEKSRLEYHNLYVKTLTPLISPTVRVLKSMSAHQIDELEHTFQRRIAEKRHEYLSGDIEQQLRRRGKKTVDLIEDWVGNLDSRQEKKIFELSANVPYYTPQWLSERESAERKLVELLRTHSSEADLRNYLKHWIESDRSGLPPITTEVSWKDFYIGSTKLVVEVGQLLNPKQKSQFQRKLLGFSQDLEILSHRGDPKVSVAY